MRGKTDWEAGRRALWLIAAFLVWTSAGEAIAGDEHDTPARDDGLAAIDIAGGAWELGFSGVVVSREGAVNSTLGVFTNRFWSTRHVDRTAYRCWQCYAACGSLHSIARADRAIEGRSNG